MHWRKERLLIYSNVGYCRCGCEVWIEYLRQANGWQTRFTVDEAGEVSHCPQCGRRLVEDDLESR